MMRGRMMLMSRMQRRMHSRMLERMYRVSSTTTCSGVRLRVEMCVREVRRIDVLVVGMRRMEMLMDSASRQVRILLLLEHRVRDVRELSPRTLPAFEQLLDQDPDRGVYTLRRTFDQDGFLGTVRES